MNYKTFENKMDNLIDYSDFYDNLIVYLITHEKRLKKNKLPINEKLYKVTD